MLYPAYGDDALSDFFGLSNPSHGWIEMTGAPAEPEKASTIDTEARTQLDPNHPERGVKKKVVHGYLLTRPVVIGNRRTEHGFAGAEKSVQKCSNLALVETAEAPWDSNMRICSPGARGGVLADRVYSLLAKEYLAITGLFEPTGLRNGEGPFQNAEVTAEVIAGESRVVATVQLIDSEPRSPSIFVFDVPELGDPSIDF